MGSNGVAIKVLVVEDNELNCRLFCDLLRVHGYDSEAVRDGREVIEKVQERYARTSSSWTSRCRM